MSTPEQFISTATRLHTSVLNCACRHAGVLRLVGIEQAAAVLDRGFDHLAGEEHDAGLDDGKQQREERQRDEAESRPQSRRCDRGETGATGV